MLSDIVLTGLNGAANLLLTLALPISTTTELRDVGTTDDDWRMTCSLGCAIDWNVFGSSHLAPIGPSTYDIEKLNDGDIRTAWVEGREGLGIGEEIVYRFPINAFGPGMDCIPFSGFRILNGYVRNEETWRENGRVKRLNVAYNGRSIAMLDLCDSPFTQEVKWSGLCHLRRGDSITLRIIDVYPGSHYDDVAISEILPQGAH